MWLVVPCREGGCTCTASTVILADLNMVLGPAVGRFFSVSVAGRERELQLTVCEQQTIIKEMLQNMNVHLGLLSVCYMDTFKY